MKSRLPAFLDKDKICIICEGDEEFDYLSRLKDLRVWSEKYEVSLDNADGNGSRAGDDRFPETVVLT